MSRKKKPVHCPRCGDEVRAVAGLYRCPKDGAFDPPDAAWWREREPYNRKDTIGTGSAGGLRRIAQIPEDE